MNKQNNIPTKRVLVIEDNNDVTLIVCAALKMKGYAASTATDGFEGFYKARREQPDLIILDLNLPRLPGEEVCRAIREDNDPKFARTPIVMLTAKVKESDRIVGKVIGADVYLTKPFEIEDIWSEAERLLADDRNNHSKGGSS